MCPKRKFSAGNLRFVSTLPGPYFRLPGGFFSLRYEDCKGDEKDMVYGGVCASQDMILFMLRKPELARN